MPPLRYIMLALALTVYGAVLLAELVGDKLFYTVAALAGRYALSSIGVGLALACAGKMLGAVALGRVISALPARLVSGMTAATFLVTAVALWHYRPGAAGAPGEAERKAPNGRSGALIAFASVFFTEWGDLGQITAASIAVRSGAPAVVCAAATAALLTKGALAMTIGLHLRRFLPVRVMRYAAVAMCLAMAAIAILRPEPRRLAEATAPTSMTPGESWGSGGGRRSEFGSWFHPRLKGRRYGWLTTSIPFSSSSSRPAATPARVRPAGTVGRIPTP